MSEPLAKIVPFETTAADRGVPDADVAAYTKLEADTGNSVLPVALWAKAAGHDLPGAEAYDLAVVPVGVPVPWIVYARLHARDTGGNLWPGVTADT